MTSRNPKLDFILSYHIIGILAIDTAEYAYADGTRRSVEKSARLCYIDCEFAMSAAVCITYSR